MCERVDGTAKAQETPIGLRPSPGALDLERVDISKENMAELLKVDAETWRSTELPDIETHFAKFGGRLPKRMARQLANMKERLGAK